MDKIDNKTEKEYNGHDSIGSVTVTQKISAGVYLKYSKELNLSLADCEDITNFIVEEYDKQLTE